MKRLIILGSLIPLLLVGCATPYQKMGLRGGFADAQIDANTFFIEFRGNAYTSRQTVEKYLLYRSAEVALAAGYDYFIFLKEDIDSIDSYYTTPGKYTSETTWSPSRRSVTKTGEYIPPQTYNYNKYEGSARIRCFRGEIPAGHLNAFDARNILHSLGPSIQKTE